MTDTSSTHTPLIHPLPLPTDLRNLPPLLIVLLSIPCPSLQNLYFELNRGPSNLQRPDGSFSTSLMSQVWMNDRAGAEGELDVDRWRVGFSHHVWQLQSR